MTNVNAHAAKASTAERNRRHRRSIDDIDRAAIGLDRCQGIGGARVVTVRAVLEPSLPRCRCPTAPRLACDRCCCRSRGTATFDRVRRFGAVHGRFAGGGLGRRRGGRCCASRRPRSTSASTGAPRRAWAWRNFAVSAADAASDFAAAAARGVLRFGAVPVARFLAGVDFARGGVGAVPSLQRRRDDCGRARLRRRRHRSKHRGGEARSMCDPLDVDKGEPEERAQEQAQRRDRRRWWERAVRGGTRAKRLQVVARIGPVDVSRRDTGERAADCVDRARSSPRTVASKYGAARLHRRVE